MKRQPLSSTLFSTLAAIAALATFSAPTARAVGTRHFVINSEAELKKGELEGVAVDSVGKVRAGLDLGKLPLDGVTVVWTATPRSDGSVLLGTGNEGKLLEVRGGRVKELAKADSLVITSIVEAFGTILVGSIGKGIIYQLKDGKLVELAQLQDAEHVLALAVDPSGQAVYAATGPKGVLYRVTRTGTSQVYFDAQEDHLMSVAVGPKGAVYTGSSDEAKLYQVTGPGRATVLYDFEKTEVRAIAPTASGELFVIANELSASTSGTARFSGFRRGGKAPKSSGKGVLYRFAPDGTPEELMKDDSEHFVSLDVAGGQPYVGTGVEGRVYTVDANRTQALVADVDERQVVALRMDGNARFLVGSDQAVFHPVRGVGGAAAVWTSEVLDAGLRARFGQMKWTATGRVELSTRSGNTKKPDDTWSDWSPGMIAPGAVRSPAARYLQVRARWNRDANAVLESIEVPFITDNLRATVTEISSDSPADPEGGTGMKASGGPVTDKPSDKVNVKWKVENPDEDELRYRLHYRMVGTTNWFSLLKPREVYTKDSYSWEVGSMPEGEYRIRVEASDELANPPGDVKRHALESDVILVDNTAPTIERLRSQGTKITGTAIDGVGPISRIEVSVAGNDEEWIPFHPKDGIFDTAREDFEANVSSIVPKGGPVLVTVRVFDRAKNSVVKTILVK